MCDDDSKKQHFSIGLESTLRHLKSRPANTHVLAIADEISPKWFGKHLVTMALARNSSMKIVILPKMKDFAKKMFNKPTIVWCMTEANESLDAFYKEIDIHSSLLLHYHQVAANKDVSIKRKRKMAPIENVSEIVHLKKTSPSSFEFITDEAGKESTKMEFEDTSDFISLAKFDDPGLVSKSSPVASYRTLKVKKTTGNVLRKGKK
jgi:hypothetical protein